MAMLAVSVATLPFSCGRLAADTGTEIPCAQNPGQPPETCLAHAQRNGDETEVVVIFPNGFRRSLYFAEGVFLRGNVTMSGVGTDTEWSVGDGVHSIRVDDQRFEVPEYLLGSE